MQSFVQFLAQHWLLLLPLVLGFAALWALMPPVREGRVFVPALVGLAALLLAGFVLPQATGVHTPLAADVLFFLFSGLAIGAGATMIVQRNPVYAALWFAVVVLSVCGLFLMESAPFLAAATIIIYAGAIIVTFLFVIMLAQQSGLAQYDRRSREPVLALVAGFLLLGGLLWALQRSYPPADRLAEVSRRLNESLRAFQGNTQASAEDLAPQFAFGQTPVDSILLEELNRLPSFPRQAALRQEIASLAAAVGQAVAAKDKNQLVNALAQYRSQAEEIDAARHRLAGKVPVPLARQAELSTLSKKTGDGKYVRGLGRTLFGDYLYGVAASAVLLLVATVGAIVIALRKPGEAA